MRALAAEHDPFHVRLAASATGLLRQFNEAGVLSAADVHVATRLASLAGEDDDEQLLLACALAVRAPRLGHVHVDLAHIRQTAAVESDPESELDSLPWPSPEQWIQQVTTSQLVVGGDEDRVAPFRLIGSWLYLDRYWADESQLAGDLLAMNRALAGEDRRPELANALGRLFGHDAEGDRAQRRACAMALERRLSVIAGGPGTGKTTTVARLVALLLEQAAPRGQRPPLVALAAPTGKAATRLAEALHVEARQLSVSEHVRDQLLGLQAMTLHRLLGRRPGSESRFGHDRSHRLPHDVVIVDETSMVSLSLMARLTEALRPQARLVLVGDPGQLASVEAGAVLGDIVGSATDARRPAATASCTATAAGRTATAARRTATAAPRTAATASRTGATGGHGLGDAIVVLDHMYRFGGGIAALAEAVRQGDADGAVALLGAGGDDLQWLAVDAAADNAAALEPLRAVASTAAGAMAGAAAAGDADGALSALAGFRLLCAHRRGPHGVSTWSARVQSWLEGQPAGVQASGGWYAGQPLLITHNDYELGLYNGDSGVIVAGHDGRLSAAFARREEILTYSPTRLSAVETLYAMTIHKSQGSQFDVAAVVLPESDSRILSRELLYTAITRARRRLIVAGTEAAIRAAVQRPIARASGLAAHLWQVP